MYINLGGKDRVLKMNYKALDALGSHFDTDIVGIFDKLNGQVRISVLTAYVWAMLKNNEGWKDATLEDVEDAIDEAMEKELFGIVGLTNMLEEVMSRSAVIKELIANIEENEDNKQKPVTRAKPRTGKK